MMFANSEFLLMLNQATTDREQLARLLGASDTQMSYVDNAPAGHGLIKVGGAIVPFANELPKNTELYRLMTTKPGEGFEDQTRHGHAQGNAEESRTKRRRFHFEKAHG